MRQNIFILGFLLFISFRVSAQRGYYQLDNLLNDFTDPVAAGFFKQGIQKLGEGEYEQADSFFVKSINTEATVSGFLFRKISSLRGKENCEPCRNYQREIEQGKYNVLKKFFQECYMPDSIVYDQFSGADSVVYEKFWVTPCNLYHSCNRIFSLNKKTGIISSYSVREEKNDESIKKRLSTPELFKRGRFIADSVVNLYPELVPSFPGGDEEMRKFLASSIHYPEEAKEFGYQGQVIVKFTVNENGAISDPVILNKGVEQCLRDEAIRIVRLMPRWNPGVSGGRLCKADYFLPVRFILQ